MTVVDIDPGAERARWLTWRRGGIGASDVAGVLGISPWASPWSVWADKVGLVPEQPETIEMEAGRWLERAIAPWFRDRTGLEPHGFQTAVARTGKDWMRCTVDGFIDDDAVYECKVTGMSRRWDDLPAHYRAQGLWQLAVTGRDYVWFAVLHGRRLETYILDRDGDDISFMTDRASQFWKDYVLPRQPPPVDGSEATLAALAAAYPGVVPDSAVAVDELGPVIARWRQAGQHRRHSERVEKELAAEIEAALGDAEVGTVAGELAVTWRPQTRTTTCKACGHREESKPFRVLRARGGAA